MKRLKKKQLVSLMKYARKSHEKWAGYCRESGAKQGHKDKLICKMPKGWGNEAATITNTRRRELFWVNVYDNILRILDK